METLVLTPQKVFMHPQRLVVPLFQRRYVWGRDTQWEPLWQDVVRVADRVLARPADRHHPHFLGAVVLQQVATQAGFMQERTVIDGQQRLTTLQLLLDALHGELLAVGAEAPARRLEPLVTNADPFCSSDEDKFKVSPTNRDRAPFNEVMGAMPPVDYDQLTFRGERMVDAHRFFSLKAREWLAEGGAGATLDRAKAIETVGRELLQMVVIDLGADENAQEIFETLNARGAQLTAVDLIKNFVFQRLLENGADVERIYEQRWKEFETAFWETEIQTGRLRYPRSSAFMNNWLVSRMGEEVVAREVFDKFKQYAAHDADAPMIQLVEHIHRSSGIYRDLVVAADKGTGEIDRLGLFAYRTNVLESEVIKPLVLCLLDPDKEPVPVDQFNKALDVVESWMVRRMLVRATTKSYTQVTAELVGEILDAHRETAGDAIERYLATQTSDSRYWPDDSEVTEALSTLPVYRRLGRGRLRMVLEAIEDHKRGYRANKAGLGEERVSRGKYAIEHVMPRKWTQHWPLPGGAESEAEREGLLHTFGNLTLLRKRLNSKVSNGPWLGASGKRAGLEEHDVLFLNRELVKTPGLESRLREAWAEVDIRTRTALMTGVILEIWKVPPGHKAAREAVRVTLPDFKIGIADLIDARFLEPGTPLFARGRKTSAPVATILSDGQIDVGGEIYDRPSAAASAIRGSATNGWWYFLVDPNTKRSLKRVRQEYSAAMSADGDDDDADDGDEGAE